LLAAPGVIATLTFAPLVIALFYSSAFGEAVDVLRWICLGIALRVITWPIGYIIVAKNRQMVFLGAEIAWTVVNVGLTWLCVKAYGLNGAGIAFCGSYVFHGIMIYLIVARMSGFRWSTENLKLGLAFLLSIGVVFFSFYVMPGLWATALGILLTMMSSIYSMRILLTLVPFARLPRPLRNLLVALRFARS
jgi:enterobacterial common antigen flippase